MKSTEELDVFSYDIEQMYIEGHRPATISKILGCHVDLVYRWIRSNGLNAVDDGWQRIPTSNF